MFNAIKKALRRRKLARTKAAYQGQIEYLKSLRHEDLQQIFQIERLVARIEVEERKLQKTPGERKEVPDHLPRYWSK